jgi:hypothetical protein
LTTTVFMQLSNNAVNESSSRYNFTAYYNNWGIIVK